MQTLESDVYTLPLDQLLKIKDTFEHCVAHLANRLGPSFSSLVNDNKANAIGSDGTAATRENILANLKPGLRIEDLKPPPAKHRRTMSTATIDSPSFNGPSPSASLTAVESPAKIPQTPAESSAASPPKTPRSPGGALRGTRGGRGNPRGRGRAKSNASGRFPTSSDIMAEVKQELAAKAQGTASVDTVDPGMTASMLAKAAASSLDPVEQRRRELEEAKNDPLTFAQNSWKALQAAQAAAAISSGVKSSLSANPSPWTFSLSYPKTLLELQISHCKPFRLYLTSINRRIF